MSNHMISASGSFYYKKPYLFVNITFPYQSLAISYLRVTNATPLVQGNNKNISRMQIVFRYDTI